MACCKLERSKNEITKLNNRVIQEMFRMDFHASQMNDVKHGLQSSRCDLKKLRLPVSAEPEETGIVHERKTS
jgi:hypothetical protein